MNQYNYKNFIRMLIEKTKEGKLEWIRNNEFAYTLDFDDYIIRVASDLFTINHIDMGFIFSVSDASDILEELHTTISYNVSDLPEDSYRLIDAIGVL